MDLQLENKTALVSASRQGIGFAIAERLKREGATVVLALNFLSLGICTEQRFNLGKKREQAISQATSTSRFRLRSNRK
jgi:3-oxoacyl-[acyl-carrier protein] reductase